MKISKNDIRALLGFIGTTSLAFVTVGVASPAVLSLVGALSSGVASNLLLELSPGKVKKWFMDVHPDHLNHDIKKLFVRSIGEALSNIQILYAESNASEQEKKEAQTIILKLKKELGMNLLDSTQIRLEEPEVKRFLYDHSSDDAIVRYVQDKFNEKGISESFGQYLAQHLAQQIQLCFGEGLKNPVNSKAWIAFQRMLAEDLQETVNRIEQTQLEIKTEISGLKQGTTGFSDEEMDEIRQLKTMLLDKKLIRMSINKSLAETLKNIEAKEDELIRTTTETSIDVKKLKSIAKAIEKKQKQITLVIYSSLTATFIVVGVLAFYLLNQPFTATIHVYGWEGRQHHPLDGKGAIELRLGDKIERAEINRQGEAIFKKLLPEYNRKLVPLSIVDTGSDPYYFADSVILVRKNETSEIQILLRGLDKLEGVVTDENGVGVSDAIVRVAGISAQTDANGRFSISIPIEKQKRNQEVEIHKEGYIPYRNVAIPMAGGSGCRIVLRNQ